jgi:hypothetical protein
MLGGIFLQFQWDVAPCDGIEGVHNWPQAIRRIIGGQIQSVRLLGMLRARNVRNDLPFFKIQLNPGPRLSLR